MKLSNYSTSDPNNPVIPDLSITPQKFVKMSFDAQQSIVARNAAIGDKGSTNEKDWVVDPSTLKGITLNEMMELKEYTDEEFKKAGSRKAKDLKKKAMLKKIDETNKPMTT